MATIDLRNLSDTSVEKICKTAKKNSSKGGRASKLRDPAVVSEFLHAISVGASYEQATHAAGLTNATFFVWMRKAREGKPECQLFANAVRQARARCLVKLAERIYDQSATDWRAAKYILQCRSKAWVEKQHMQEINGIVNQILRLASQTLSKKDYQNLLDAIASDTEEGEDPTSEY